MIESLITEPGCQVREEEYFRLLGYPPGHEPGARALELAAWARRWYAGHGRPWTYFREVSLEASEDGLRLDGQVFQSAKLHAHLRQSGCRRAVVFAASAGRACEEHARRLWEEGKPDEYFFLEVFGSAVVEQLVAGASGQVCALAETGGWMAVPHYSPGYAGWDVAEQNRLHELVFRGGAVTTPAPLEVLASGMLRPKKSLLAVIGLTPHDGQAPVPDRWVPCHRCSFSPCRYRRGPYRPARGGPEGTLPSRPAAPAGYTINSRALQKWAGERLQWRLQGDGRVEAVFRFDGTTCSNLGQPLAFEYAVVLGPREEGHPILRADCRPAAEDDGHEKMCAYLSDGPALLRAIGDEKPLLGRPLQDVFGWERSSAPAGCLCTAESRAHKWGLALEVVHYALARAADGPPPTSPPS